MKILALEFSSTHRSIAVAEVEGNTTRILGQTHEPFSRSSSVALIHDLLKGCGAAGIPVSPTEIEMVAIGLGPGSYTGIRSSISIAQGFELAGNTKIVGLSSMEILAEQLAREEESGEFHLIADAQKGEVYHQQFFVKNGKAEPTTSLKIVSVSSLVDVPRQKIVGSEASGFLPGSREMEPRAATLAQLINLVERKTIAGEKLEPIYLREIAFVKAKPPRMII